MTLATPKWKPGQWDKVSEICNNTIRSILNQTADNYKLILVCNQPPLDLPVSEKIIVTQTDLPCPVDYNGVINDIFQKIKIGMTVARDYGPAFIMRIDADDFVSRDLVKFTENHPKDNGWYIKWGYCYDYYHHKMYHQPNLHLNCGTAHIINCQKEDFPMTRDTPDTDWLKCIWQHQNINQFLSPMGRTLRPLPFPGVIRSVNTSVNSEAKPVVHKNLIKRFITEQFLKKTLNKKIIAEFSLPVPTRSVTNESTLV